MDGKIEFLRQQLICSRSHSKWLAGLNAGPRTPDSKCEETSCWSCCLTALLVQEQLHVSSQWIEHNIKYIYFSEPTEQANSPWRRRQSSQWHRIRLCPIKHPSRAGEPIRLRLKKDPGWKAWGGCSKAHPTRGAEGGGWTMTEAEMDGDWIQDWGWG